MDQTQKTYLSNWERTKKFKNAQGSETSLEVIISDTFTLQTKRAQAGATDVRPSGNEAKAEIRSHCHPWLYYNYIISWRDLSPNLIPKGFKSGEELGRAVIREWQNECYKKKFYRSSMLSVYDNIDQLRTNSERLLDGDALFVGEGYIRHEEMLYEMRQAEIDAAEEKHRKEQEALEALRQREIAENNLRRANQLADQARRNAAAYEAESQSRAMRGAVADTPAPAVCTSPVTATAPAAPAPVTIDNQLRQLYEEWNRFESGEKESGTVSIDLYYAPSAYPDKQFCCRIYNNATKAKKTFMCASFPTAIAEAFDFLHHKVIERQEAERKAQEKQTITDMIAEMQRKHEAEIKALMDKLNAI